MCVCELNKKASVLKGYNATSYLVETILTEKRKQVKISL